MIEKIELKNFTKFGNLTGEQAITFSPNINIIIGENGTGKTHLLKAAYLLAGAAALDQQQVDVAARFEWKVKQLEALFKPIDGDLSRLVRRPLNGQRHAVLGASFAAGGIEIKIPSKQGGTISGGETKSQMLSGPPIFIPTKEVMSLVGGMSDPASDNATLVRLFDQTYFDLCALIARDPVTNEAKEIENDPRFGNVYEKLAEAINGKFVFEGGKVIFYPGEYQRRFKKDSNALIGEVDPEKYAYSDTKTSQFVIKTGEAVSAHMSAEGVRKLGVIQRLVLNKGLSPGISGPLIWDEPETNMNPKLLRKVVEVLIELSRNGQQIILATHDYVLLKWFDLLMDKGKGDHVRFHSLFVDEENNGTKMASTDSYLEITPNPIDEAFASLVDSEIESEMGSLGK